MNTPILKKRGDVMLRNELSSTAKRRLAHNCKCGICNDDIKDYQDFQMLVFPYGNRKVYRFFHTFCLIQNEGSIYSNLCRKEAYFPLERGSENCPSKETMQKVRSLVKHQTEVQNEDLQHLRNVLESHSSHCASNYKY